MENIKLKTGSVLGQIFLLILISSLCLFIFFNIKSMLNGILVAFALHILLRPWHTALSKKKWMGTSRASLVLMLASFFCIMMPIVFLSLSLVNGFQSILNNYEDILLKISAFINASPFLVSLDIANEEFITSAKSKIADYIPQIFNSTTGIISEMVMMYFTLYFTLTEKERMEAWVRNILPYSDVNNQKILSELKSSTVSNLIGIPLIGIVQGLFSWIAYSICGIDQAFSWALITGIVSIIPVVGTALIWLPLALYLIIMGQMQYGLILMAMGVLVITNLDNGVRLIVSKKIANVHSLIVIFGVIIGLSSIGFMGIIFGPLLLSYLFILIEIYRDEYNTKKQFLILDT
ncbi:MAG: AI-2E family transporter [Bacteroidetes bacterium]|nr:AI-2E family transporter [Bacteroidota bacterium]